MSGLVIAAIISALILLLLLIVVVILKVSSSATTGTKTSPTGAVSTQPFPEGSVVRCGVNIYKIENGAKRMYGDWNVFVRNGSPPFTDVDCNLLNKVPFGPQMP